MAEEQGVKIEGEAGEGSQNPNIESEQRAVKSGWVPKDQFKGDPADWVEAKEFVARQPLFDKINDLRKEIRSQREKFDQDMGVISKQFAQMTETAYKRALADLKAERNKAISDGDVESVTKLDEQIEDVQKTRQEAQETAKPKVVNPAETPEFIDWRGKNKWFDSDTELQQEAVSIGVGYIAAHQGKKTQAEMLEYVTDRIKRIYPEKFQRKQVKEKEEGSDVEGGGGVSRPANSSKKLTAADLDEREREVMKVLIKRGALKDLAAKNKRSEEAEYLAQYQERLNRR